MKLTLTSIKRNPKGPSQDASYEEKMKFYEKVKYLSRQMINDSKDYAQAKVLYSRALPLFNNMSKKQKKELSPNEVCELNETKCTLLNNLSLCALKQSRHKDCIRHSEESLKIC